MSRSRTTSLTENTIYRLGNLLLEAARCDVWTLIILTSEGEHVPRRHGALVAYQLRPDGLWDTIYDCQKRMARDGLSWCYAYGATMQIDPTDLIYVAENRSALQSELRDKLLEQNFLEIMATMEW